jgi:5-methyltetrahydrofolate--homocysteine methyltransferase
VRLVPSVPPPFITAIEKESTVETILKRAAKTVVIGPGRPTVLIGERINPTGKKRLAAALAEGDLEIVRTEALQQVEAGADVLDVNVGAAGVDEVDLLPKAVRLVMETVDVPVCIDSANVKALRAALDVHRALAPEDRPLLNSVNGEEARLEAVLPLVAEYGTAVIGLAMDDAGIPATVEGRLAAARKIVERAEAMGIPREAILIDCLALTVGADSRAGRVTLDAIQRVREELGVNMTLGASNVSFGLPEREVVNWAFLALTIQNGVNCPIVDASKVRPAILAVDLLLGRDEYAMRYLKAYKKRAKRGG